MHLPRHTIALVPITNYRKCAHKPKNNTEMCPI